MKLIVLDGYTLNPGDLDWGDLRELGDLAVYDRTPPDKIVERIGDAEIVFTNKTPLARETFAACPAIKYVGVFATGFNVVDIDAASEKGVVVANVPDYSTAAVTQFTFALLLEICHNVADHSRSVHAGEWTRCADFCYWRHPLIELSGKTLGIVGFGRIGQSVAKLAEAFGMRVLAHSRTPKPEAETENIRTATLDEVLSASDVVSLHCPLTPETTGIVNRASIARMRDGVIVLNTARGPLIVERDLREALDSGKVAAAGVDVVSTEPIPADSPLLGAKNCFITPHIAWAALETRKRLMATIVANVRAFLSGSPVNIVNRV